MRYSRFAAADLYSVKKPGTLPFVAETSDLGLHPGNAPVAPRRAKPKGRAARFLVILVASLLVGNALIGQRGLVSMIRADQEFVTLSGMLFALRAENEGLRHQVRQLREEPRVIEELAREELGFIRPGEMLFIVTPVSVPMLQSSPPVLAPAP